MQVGLAGSGGCGKTTLFELLSQTEGSFLSPDQAHTAAVDVPDPRLAVLAGIFSPKKITPAKIFFTDTNRLVPGDRANNNKALSHLRLLDALAVVVDGFTPGRTGAEMRKDLDFCLSEMVLSDLEQVEGKLERLRKSKSVGSVGGLPEEELFSRFADALQSNQPLSSLPLPPQVQKALGSYSFLTAKPFFIVANLSEAFGTHGPPGLEEFEQGVRTQNRAVVRVYAKLEKDLQELSADERTLFTAEYALPLDGRATFIRQAYATAGLVSFLTAGEKEVRAWTVPRDCPAQEAAGVIHKDFMHHFIRAEVVTYEHLLEAGSFAEASRRGWLRAEKKEYPVQDGDVVTFLAGK